MTDEEIMNVLPGGRPWGAPLITDLIDPATVQGIADETWLVLLGANEILVPGSGVAEDVPEELVSAWVPVTGPWTGRVMLTCARSTAQELARILLREPLMQPVDAEDVRDAMGELANVVGGNVKAVLPGPSVLGLPVVSGPPPSDSAADTCRLRVAWRGRPLTVTLQGAARTPIEAVEEVRR